MNIKEAIQKRILDLKSRTLTIESKKEIQRLQQLLDEPTDIDNSADTSNKNNSAKNT